jgi:photosystem II stability/assembly factor-like uncharacterized protein
VGIAVGASGTIRRTSNGGSTWSAGTVSGGTLGNLNCVKFVPGSAAIAYAVGDNGLAAKTTNGGVTWTFIPASTLGAGTGSLRAIVFQDADLGLIVGTGGAVRKIEAASGIQTYDFGGTIPGNPDLRSAAYAFIAGDFLVAGDGGIVYKTFNFNHANPAWSAQTINATQDLTQIQFADASHGFAAGSAGILFKTTDAGATWTPSDTAAQALNGLHVSNAYVGHAVGVAGALVKTTAGGSRWPSGIRWNTAYFINNTTGWVAGDGGVLMATSAADAGRVWSPQASGTTRNLLGMHFFDGTTNGQVVGDAGAACKTTNGTSWSCVTAGTRPLRSVVVTSTGNGGVVYAVGDGLWKCSNFSRTQTWSSQTNAGTQPLNGVDFTSTTAGYAVGGLESVLGTTNGTAWSLRTSGTRQFDTLLTYKYLKPNQPHTLLLDAMVQFSLPLKGYQQAVTLNIGAGKDTTLLPGTYLARCGYGGPACL